MRKTLLLSLFLLICRIGFSQPTINSWRHPATPVDSADHMIVNNPSIDVIDKNGSNSTWDLSSVGGSGIERRIHYLTPSASSKGGDYPNSDLFENEIGSNGGNFYMRNSSEFSLEGSYIPGEEQVIYDDLREFMQYPMDFNDVVTDSFSGTAENLLQNQTYDRAGTVESTYDGYGTLILPYDTVDNVARIRNVGSYSDEQSGFSVANYRDTIIVWYNTQNMAPVASRTVTYNNGTLSHDQATYLSESTLINSIGEAKDDRELSVELRPNPASERFRFELPEGAEAEKADIEILDMTGRSVQRIRGDELHQSVDISGLESGVHFLRYEGKKGSVTKKLMVR